jgi:hypothetical protein
MGHALMPIEAAILLGRPSLLMGPAKKHQARIESVRAELAFIPQAYDDATEVLEKLAPEKLLKPLADDDEMDIPF